MTPTAVQIQKGVPGIPAASLAAISDPNVRQVLQALNDGWNVRNGGSGAGGRRFVTLDELDGVRSKATSALQAAQQANTSAAGAGQLKPGEIGRIITDLQASVMNSPLWNELGERIRLIDVDTKKNAAELKTEVAKRLEEDRAIVQSTTVQYTVINTNLAALQQQFTTTSNTVAALSQALITLQSTVGQNTVALQQEMTTRANVDKDLYAKYSVKIDINGYVTGFGLMSTANNGTPFSEFIVRVDRFAVGSPAGPGIKPLVPFIITTTPTVVNGQYVPPGVYISELAVMNGSIGRAQIGLLQVDTMHLEGEAIFVSRYMSAIQSTPLSTGWSIDMVTLTLPLDMGGLTSDAGVIINMSGTAYPTDETKTNLGIGIFVNGSLISDIYNTFVADGISFSNTAFIRLWAGTHTISVRVRCRAEPFGASSKPSSAFLFNLVAQSGKR